MEEMDTSQITNLLFSLSPSPPPHPPPLSPAHLVCPTNKALLINFLLSSDAEIFVDKRRLSMQIDAKACKNVACNVCVFRLSSRLACHRCWLGFVKKTNLNSVFSSSSPRSLLAQPSDQIHFPFPPLFQPNPLILIGHTHTLPPTQPWPCTCTKNSIPAISLFF